MSDRKLPMDKSERILNELLKIPVNTICCDCGAANPKWASFSLGCFLCVRCCSVHRKMGTHISKVKSTSLDSWTQEDIDTMKNWGNGKVNAMYMPHPEKHPPPTSMEGSAMEQYIRSKYERKEFMEGGGGGSGNSYQSSSRSAYGNTFSGGHGNSRSNNDVVSTNAYTTQMKALRAMGFTDNAKNLQVLQSTDGDVPNAIEILCRIGQGPATATANMTRSNTTNQTNNRTPARTNTTANNNSSSDPKEKILWSMGFHDSALNKEALRRAGGNPEVAAGILIDDKDKLAKAVREKGGSSSPLPSKLDPPGSNNNRNTQADNLLLDLSDDTNNNNNNNNNNQQQLMQQQLMLQQQQMQQMQMQNAFGNNNNAGMDQFGQNQNQLQSILDKNASILALYNNNEQNNAFGLQQQQQPVGGGNMNEMWAMNNNNNNNNNMAMSNAFGLQQQSSMATGMNNNNNMFGAANNNNMFGNNNANGMMGMNSGMGTMTTMQQQHNPFGAMSAVSQQSSGGNFSTPTSGFNNAFGNLGNSNNNNNNNSNAFAGLGTMSTGSPMVSNSNIFGTPSNNNNMFASGNTGMGGMGNNNNNNNGGFGTMNGMNGMNGMSNNNNNFNAAFGGMNPNQGNQNNPWGQNNNNNNNNNNNSFF
ncbi:hypothetical protein BGZ83_007783 [Gryganskiella cystojenkinii]|nr:hypothetical protein BGZ83_007783 [Gryganskiella cystojenkinii]